MTIFGQCYNVLDKSLAFKTPLPLGISNDFFLNCTLVKTKQQIICHVMSCQSVGSQIAGYQYTVHFKRAVSSELYASWKLF